MAQKEIKIKLPYKQTLVISNIKTTKIRTDDGWTPAKDVVETFAHSIELWTEQINDTIKEKPFSDIFDRTKKEVIDEWMQGIYNDIDVINLCAKTKILNKRPKVKMSKQVKTRKNIRKTMGWN